MRLSSGSVLAATTRNCDTSSPSSASGKRQAGSFDNARDQPGMGANGEIDGRLAQRLQPEHAIAAKTSGRGANLPQSMTDRRIAARDKRHATCPHSVRICAPGPLRSHECDTLRWQEGKRCVGDVKHSVRQENGGCRSIRRLPSPAPRHRLRGLGNQEVLETSISSRSALASSMRFASRLRCATSSARNFCARAS